MIKTSHTARRLSCSVFAASTLLISAQFASAAPVDASIIAFRAAATAANIEDIAGLAKTTAAGFTSGAVKANSKNVKSLAAFAADSIIAKITNAAENRPDNKADEIGEVGAVIIDALAGTVKVATKSKKAKPLIITAMKGLLNTAKQTAELFGTTIFRDVAGSVSLNIANNTGFAAIRPKLEKALKKAKTQKKIAGKTNAVAIQLGVNEGFLNDAVANAKYETDTVIDPETDTRPA